MFRLGLSLTFLAVTAASSWVTLQALNYLDGPRAISRRIVEPGGAIIVAEATYGISCRHSPNNRVEAGNVTGAVAAACNRKTGNCPFTVDVVRLGDPANGCAKDFYVAWRCGAGGVPKEARLPPEANGKTISLSCPR